MIPSLEPGHSLHQTLDVLYSLSQNLIRSLPHPTTNEVSHSIINMKTVVDNQELRIQRNMREIEQEEIYNEDRMTKKISISTNNSANYWEDSSAEQIKSSWAWNDENFRNSEDF